MGSNPSTPTFSHTKANKICYNQEADFFFWWTIIVFAFTIIFCICTGGLISPDTYSRYTNSGPTFAPFYRDSILNECTVKGTNIETYQDDLDWCMTQFRVK